MAINRDDFARTCVDDALFVGVDPTYLILVAQILSSINDDKDGDRIGPYRVTLPDWRANGSNADLQVTLSDDDINNPMMQCMYAALQTLRAQESLRTSLGRFPSPVELYAVWPKDPAATEAQIQKAIDDVKDLVSKAIDAALADMDIAVPAGDINSNGLPPGRQTMATLIMNAFADAGYGKAQQIAAVANAIAESNLNPNAVSTTPKERSVGLFQLNMQGGLGAGHDVAELQDPAKNTALIIQAANKSVNFKAATTIQDAVAAFVRDVERPANVPQEIVRRVAIAQKLV